MLLQTLKSDRSPFCPPFWFSVSAIWLSLVASHSLTLKILIQTLKLGFHHIHDFNYSYLKILAAILSAVLSAILVFCQCYIFVFSSIAFREPKNFNLDSKIMFPSHTTPHLQPFEDNGRHFVRHFGFLAVLHICFQFHRIP